MIIDLLSNLCYKIRQITKPQCSSSRHAVVFAQSTEAKWRMKMSTILLATKVCLILVVEV